MAVHDAEYHRNYYRDNPGRKAKVAERRERIRQENLEYLREVKARPCSDCGVQYPYYIMQFDHLRDKEVNFGGKGRKALSWSRKRLDAELEKCEVVCANCHFERTHQRRTHGSLAETD